MSLINDALKKAARQRAEDQADFRPPMPGGGRRPSRHGDAVRPGNTVLIVSAAVALAVVSAVATAIFISGRSEKKPATVSSAPVVPRPAPPQSAPSSGPMISVSLPAAAKVAESVSPPRTTPVPTAAPTAAPLGAPTAAPVAARPAEAAQAPAVVVSASDRVQNFIDAIHITGVRYSGADSKAIVDGHIYRVNELLDKALGIRLVKVDPDHLTFSDPAGTRYVKSF